LRDQGQENSCYNRGDKKLIDKFLFFFIKNCTQNRSVVEKYEGKI